MNELQLFSQSILSRSKENNEAFACLYEKQLYGNCFSILRQELDSLIRIIYLLNIDNPNEREHFIQLTVTGRKWSLLNDKGKKQFITDRDMIDLASNHCLFGWANYVYKFGCGFIHLSQLHSYGITNPFQMLNDQDKSAIIGYMNQYHSANISQDSSLTDFIPYLPDIMKKVSNHVCYYTTEYILTQSVWDKS